MSLPSPYVSPAILKEHNLSADDIAAARTESAPRVQIYEYLATLFVLLLANSSPAIGDEKLNLNNGIVQVSVALNGGGITDFRFLDGTVNPLNWEMAASSARNGKPHLRGHFLCLDRWGAPSEAEIGNGMTFHGEAPYATWHLVSQGQSTAGDFEAVMSCKLPIAKLTIHRTVQLKSNAALLIVSEQITNVGKLGRIYNIVQHPSIAPPFLDPDTIVDSNARHGFLQGADVPESRADATMWPNVLIHDNVTNLRHFHHDISDSTRSDVSAFVFDDREKYGWVTACSPNTGLLLGYLWNVEDYPWLDVWRAMSNGKVAARGLEFGTTGLHQPYAELVRVGRILGRSLYEYIDANATVEKSYLAFLVKIPHDFEGVAEISYGEGKLELIERRVQKPRVFSFGSGTPF